MAVQLHFWWKEKKKKKQSYLLGYTYGHWPIIRQQEPEVLAHPILLSAYFIIIDTAISQDLSQLDSFSVYILKPVITKVRWFYLMLFFINNSLQVVVIFTFTMLSAYFITIDTAIPLQIHRTQKLNKLEILQKRHNKKFTWEHDLESCKLWWKNNHGRNLCIQDVFKKFNINAKFKIINVEWKMWRLKNASSLLIHNCIIILNANCNQIENHAKNVQPEILNINISWRAFFDNSLHFWNGWSSVIFMNRWLDW